MPPEGALPCAASIPRKTVEFLGLTDERYVIWMILALQGQLLPKLACLLELTNDISPHGGGPRAAEGVGIANQNHAMLSSRQQHVDSVGGVQEACLALVIAADQGHQDDFALFSCMAPAKHLHALIALKSPCGNILCSCRQKQTGEVVIDGSSCCQWKYWLHASNGCKHNVLRCIAHGVCFEPEPSMSFHESRTSLAQCTLIA